MITPEPPAGSEHYREGWRHGYEQAAIDRERSTDAARPVPDTGQARSNRLLADMLARKERDLIEMSEEVDRLRNAAAVPDPGQARGLRVIHPRERDDMAAALHSAECDCGDRPHHERETGADYNRLATAAIKHARIASGDTVQAPDVASRVDTELMLLARAVEKMAGYDNDVQAPWVVERIGLIRALLGTDTTPDRLAWIDTAAETAAVERQARYQETACARRPAATSGDPAQPDLAYARSEVNKWLADNDPYCILPTRTEHIPALLARLDELEGPR